MDYKLRLTTSLKRHFLEDLGNTDIKISAELSKFLIPTLLNCLETSLNKALIDMKDVINVEQDTNKGG